MLERHHRQRKYSHYLAASFFTIEPVRNWYPGIHRPGYNGIFAGIYKGHSG